MNNKGKLLEFSLSDLYVEIGYEFKTPSILIQALKDPSCKNNKFIDKNYDTKVYLATRNNKTLAFYGDLAIYGAIGKILKGTYSFNEGEKEEYTFFRSLGELHKKKKNLSKNKVFHSSIENSKFANKYLLKGENFQIGKKTYANLFEAVLGAVAIDSNWNYQIIIKVFKKMFSDYKEKLFDDKDYKKLLKGIIYENCLEKIAELKNNKDIKVPKYVELDKEDDLFVYQCYIQHIGKGIGKGKSKKEAKRNACFNTINIYLGKKKN